MRPLRSAGAIGSARTDCHRLSHRGQHRLGGCAGADSDPHAAVSVVAGLQPGSIEHLAHRPTPRLQVHVTSVTHAIRRLEANGLVQRVPHPTDGRTTLVEITDLGRSTVEDATVTLNEQVFADIGISERESQALASSIETLRRGAGDF